MEREGRDSEVALTYRGCQGKQGPCKAREPLSWLAESGLKQAGACTEDLGGELGRASPRQGIKTREARGHQDGWLTVA